MTVHGKEASGHAALEGVSRTAGSSIGELASRSWELVGFSIHLTNPSRACDGDNVVEPNPGESTIFSPNLAHPRAILRLPTKREPDSGEDYDAHQSKNCPERLCGGGALGALGVRGSRFQHDGEDSGDVAPWIIAGSACRPVTSWRFSGFYPYRRDD